MRSKGSSPTGEKSRFRFVLVEGEVAPGELQMFAQTFAAALKPPQQQNGVQAHQAAITTPPALPRPQVEQPSLFDEGPAEDEVPEPGSLPAAKSHTGVKKKLRTPQLVSELEFTSGPKSLEEYIHEIDPKEHSRRYLALTYWLRQYRNCPEVSGDHIYSCYRALGLHVPRDVGSVFRALKRQEWVEPGSKTGCYKITHIGENLLTKPKE